MPAGHDISYAPLAGPWVIYPDENTFVIENTGIFTQFFRLILNASERATLAGNARLYMSDSLNDPSTLRFRSPTSSTLSSDEFVVRHNRVIFNGNVRETIGGSGRSIIIDDLSPRPGRLILAGAGGGS